VAAQGRQRVPLLLGVSVRARRYLGCSAVLLPKQSRYVLRRTTRTLTAAYALYLVVQDSWGAWCWSSVATLWP
jgi:hypothetical protein